MTKSTSIFKKHSEQTSTVNSLSGLFSSFFIAEHNGHYFLQLGLKKPFSNEDTLGNALPAPYQTALKTITEYLAKLKLIPSEENFCLRGHDMLYAHIVDSTNPYTTAYDATPLTHFVVELAESRIHSMKKLVTLLNDMRLPERDKRYPIYETNKKSKHVTENNVVTEATRPTQRF